MNDVASAEAAAYLSDCLSILERRVDGVELLRFTYYYALERRAREEHASEWLEFNRPDVAKRLSPPATPRDEISDETAAENNGDMVDAAILLANRATLLQARARGRMARGRAKVQACNTNEAQREASKEASMWQLVIAEQREQQLSELRAQLNAMQDDAEKKVAQLNSDIAKLQQENARLERELARRVSELAAGRAGAGELPALTVAERLHALNWLAKNRPEAKRDEKREERAALYAEMEEQGDIQELINQQQLCQPAEGDSVL